MLFNSYIFIFIFFPLCITGFYLLNNVDNSDWAKTWLIGLSLWFYGYFNLSYLGIMILSILVNYGLTMWITRFCDENNVKKKIMALGIALNLGLLFYFKYFDFFISNVNSVFGTDYALLGILLPLGISFFTFQQIGFLIDVYRGDIERVSFVDYALFVSFFPQLIAGPIVSWEEMGPGIRNIGKNRFDTERVVRGLNLFILGLAKKVLIADVLGRAVDVGYASLEYMNGLDSFLIMIWYSLQLYFDFSGYCDMAKGLASMLGFELPINFDSPYKAANIVDFWKRWHRTLTRFFTKYVYIPLGGNRKGEARMLVNILIVYFLSGLWHGAGWNFILWGMMHGVMYVVVRMLQKHLIKERTEKTENIAVKGILTVVKGILTIVNFIYVSMAWVYFRASSISEGTLLIRNILTKSWEGVAYSLSEALKLDEIWYAVKILHLDRFAWSQGLVMYVITIVALLITFICPNANYISTKIKPKLAWAICFAILGIWCVLNLSQVSTFLYFNF